MLLIHWARRYSDQRCTFAPREFNKVYAHLLSKYPFLDEFDMHDPTLMHGGAYFPYAQDGDFDPDSSSFDARKWMPYVKQLDIGIDA